MPPCLSLLEMLHVCVGDLFWARFLRCQSVLCVSDYLSLHAPRSFYSLVMPPLLPFHPLSPLPLSLTPAIFLSCFHLSVIFSGCVSCQKKRQQGLEVGGFFDLFIIFVWFFFCFFLRILKAVFDLKPTTVGLHEIPARPGWRFHLWDIQPKGPEVVLMTGLQCASTGLLPAWEDDIFHQCFIFTALSSSGYTVRWVRWTDRFYKAGLDLH